MTGKVWQVWVQFCTFHGYNLRQALPYCHDGPVCEDLAAAVRTIKPSVLIGISDGGAPMAFGRDVCAAMAAEHERPVILPLSQPGAPRRKWSWH